MRFPLGLLKSVIEHWETRKPKDQVQPSSEPGLKCACGGLLVHSGIVSAHTWLVCQACGRKESLTGLAVVRNLIPIEPLPPGALPIYDKDPGVTEILEANDHEQEESARPEGSAQPGTKVHED